MDMNNCRKLSVSLPKSVEDAVRDMAKAENRSFSNMIAVILADRVEERKKKAA